MAKPVEDFVELPELRKLIEGVGARVRELRTQHSISQKDLAALADIKVPYLNEIERLGINITLKKLFQISQALGVKPSDLLPETTSSGDLSVPLSVVRKGLTDLAATFQHQVAELLSVIDAGTHVAHAHPVSDSYPKKRSRRDSRGLLP